MLRLHFAQRICTALIPCLLCGFSSPSHAQEGGEFLKNTVTLRNGITVTQYINAATFPSPDGAPQETTNPLLPEVDPVGLRLIRVLLTLDEKRDPKFIMGVPPKKELLMGVIANGTLNLLYYRDGKISIKDNPFGHPDLLVHGDDRSDASSSGRIPAWGRSIKLLRPISKDATHLAITASIAPDSATAPGQERKANMVVIVRDAVVSDTGVTVDEPLTTPIAMKVSDASWRLWHRVPILAGSGNTLENVANAPFYDLAAVEQRTIESGADARHHRNRRDSMSMASDAENALGAGEFEPSALFDTPATRDDANRAIRFLRSAVTAAEAG